MRLSIFLFVEPAQDRGPFWFSYILNEILRYIEIWNEFKAWNHFRKIIQLNAVIILKSTNEHYSKILQKVPAKWTFILLWFLDKNHFKFIDAWWFSDWGSSYYALSDIYFITSSLRIFSDHGSDGGRQWCLGSQSSLQHYRQTLQIS